MAEEELHNRIINMFQLINIKDEVTEVYFYGAGCGTPKACAILKKVMEAIFKNALELKYLHSEFKELLINYFGVKVDLGKDLW